MHEANETTAGGREREACLVYFPRLCVRKGSVFCSAATARAFPGEVRDKIEKRLLRGSRGGTGKRTLGRTERESPHSMSDKGREAGVFGDGSVEHKCWQIETKQ